MCSPRQSDSSLKMSEKKYGVRLWYFIKIVEYVLIAVSILLLVLNEYLSIVYDDFTPAYTNETRKGRPSNEKKLFATNPTPTKPRSEDRGRLRIKRANDDHHHHHHHPETKLSYLLILYPCCTTVVMFLTMELLAQALKDSLNRLSNIILIALCTLLSVAIFAVSLICAIDTVHVSMILVTILCAALVVIACIDFILLVLS